jgi:DNA-binding NtrC family response regulator
MIVLPLARGETVLVVEQDAARRLRDEELLAALGYEPVGFGGAPASIAACHESPKRFDVVVLGRLSPDTRALDLTAALHGIAPHLPVLLTMTAVDNCDADSLANAGVTDVVSWPLNAAEIAAALQRCLQRLSGAARRRV